MRRLKQAADTCLSECEGLMAILVAFVWYAVSAAGV